MSPTRTQGDPEVTNQPDYRKAAAAVPHHMETR